MFREMIGVPLSSVFGKQQLINLVLGRSVVVDSLASGCGVGLGVIPGLLDEQGVKVRFLRGFSWGISS